MTSQRRSHALYGPVLLMVLIRPCTRNHPITYTYFHSLGSTLKPCYTVHVFMQLVSQCLKKDFDNALQEVLHAAMIFMQLETIRDRGMRRD
jgi:hypothetical protein